MYVCTFIQHDLSRTEFINSYLHITLSKCIQWWYLNFDWIDEADIDFLHQLLNRKENIVPELCLQSAKSETQVAVCWQNVTSTPRWWGGNPSGSGFKSWRARSCFPPHYPSTLTERKLGCEEWMKWFSRTGNRIVSPEGRGILQPGAERVRKLCKMEHGWDKERDVWNFVVGFLNLFRVEI